MKREIRRRRSRFNAGNPMDEWIRSTILTQGETDWVSYRKSNRYWNYAGGSTPFTIRKVVAVPGVIGKANYWLLSSEDEMPRYWRLRGQALRNPSEWRIFVGERPLVAGALLHRLISKDRLSERHLVDDTLWGERKWPVDFGRALLHSLALYRNYHSLTTD